MAKFLSWYEVPNAKTGEIEKYRDPLNPDAFPEDEEKKQREITDLSEQKTNKTE